MSGTDGRYFYRSRLSYPSPVRVNARLFDPRTPVATVPPSRLNTRPANTRPASPRSPRFVPKRSLGDLQMIVSRIMEVTSRMEREEETGLPGLYNALNFKRRSRGFSPSAFSTPASRRQSITRPDSAPRGDSAYNSANDLAGTISISAPSPIRGDAGEALLLPTTEPSTASDVARDGVLVEHQYKIKHLERRLSELETSILKGAGEGWSKRLSVTSLLSDDGEAPTSAPPTGRFFRTNPFFSTRVPSMDAMSASFPGPQSPDHSTPKTFQPEASSALVAKEAELSSLTLRFQALEQELAEIKASSARDQSSAQSTNNRLSSRVSELETALGEYNRTVSELRRELDKEKQRSADLERELEEARDATGLDATPELVYPVSVELDSLQLRLAEKEALLEELQSRLRLQKSPSTLDTGSLAQIRAARIELAAASEVVAAFARKQEPDLDAVLGTPTSKNFDPPSPASSEVASLRCEVTALAAQLRDAYADSVTSDVQESCRVS